jgi:hypothetical protein
MASIGGLARSARLYQWRALASENKILFTDERRLRHLAVLVIGFMWRVLALSTQLDVLFVSLLLQMSEFTFKCRRLPAI